MVFDLTHWGRDKMVSILQTTFSNAFSWTKILAFPLKFHWICSLMSRWCHLTSIDFHVVEIRVSYDHLISTMGIPILIWWYFYFESGPGLTPVQFQYGFELFCSWSILVNGMKYQGTVWCYITQKYLPNYLQQRDSTLRTASWPKKDWQVA